MTGLTHEDPERGRSVPSTLEEVLQRQKVSLAAFLTMSAFQENEVVSPLSLGVCKQNTHLLAML